MRVPLLIGAGLLVVAAGWADAPAHADPATRHLDGVAQRLAELDAVPVGQSGKQRRALSKALSALASDSASAVDDLRLAKKVARKVRRPFAEDAELDAALTSALDGLRDAATTDRIELARLLDRAPASKWTSKSSKRLASGVRLFDKAELAHRHDRRAGLLRKAWQRLEQAAQLLSRVEFPPPEAPAGGPLGAIAYKSGPIQITADGAYVWVVNPDNGTVTRITTADEQVDEFQLPPNSTTDPRGLSITPDGTEVWVACPGEDRVFVLNASDGTLNAVIEVPFGTAPHALAVSPDGTRVLVTGIRSASVVGIDRATRKVVKVVRPVHDSPLSVTWVDDGSQAWITHVHAEEHPALTCIDWSGDEPRAVAQVTAFATGPRQSNKLAKPYDIAEGGYLTFRGHAAQIPSVSGRHEIWLPTQYSNIHEDRFSADSTIQATVRHLDLDTLTVPNATDDKIILTAVHVHDPATNPEQYVGPGWDAHVAGPIDIAFSADASVAYLVCEQSNDVVVLPTNTPAVRPSTAPKLTEIRVGDRPTGIVVSPTTGAVYVTNRFSRDVSVIDGNDRREARRIGVMRATVEPYTDERLRGAKLFHTSADSRVSSNEKVSCASCHVDGEHDGRSWGFHTLPGRHGPRQTPTLAGFGDTLGPRDPVTGFGQLHRSGDRDEVQDFEHTFRGPQMGGTGLISGAVQPELGAPNAGLSSDLDALAVYVTSLPAIQRSPFREGSGGLTPAAERGATFFVGNDPQTHKSDASCADCHVPETAFVDFRFHDVGQQRASNEKELNDGSNPARVGHFWEVNTPTLVGVWGTPAYDGVSGFADNLLDLVQDLQKRGNHGTPAGLSGRQLADFVEFLSSIDGRLTAAEVRNARDTRPPRIVTVAPTSLTRVDVWLDEAIDPLTAEKTTNWTITRGAQVFPVTAAVLDTQNGDRVTLTTLLEPGCDAPFVYTVSGSGIADRADQASGGVANVMTAASFRSSVDFELGSELTITLGASGYENLTIPVHDASMVAPNLSTWSHDHVTMHMANGNQPVKGFVRFDWRQAFSDVTGVAGPDALLAAAIRLQASHGAAQQIEVRRCLQSWGDAPGFKDWNQSADGAPTWRDHAHPNGRWNTAGARKRTAGVDGRVAADYDGANDLAFTPDVIAQLEAINETFTIEGGNVTEAFRFWFDRPDLDYGYGLELRQGATQAAVFRDSERRLRRHGPVLVLTYRLPGCE